MPTDPSSTPTVGLVTINDDRNFGNRLQNFALQEALRTLGWRVETIRNTPPPMAKRLLAKRAWYALRKDGPTTFARRNLALLKGRAKSTPSTGPAPLLASRRQVAIGRFARDRIHHTQDIYDSSKSPEWADRYAKVVVGSDQVWNHGFRNAQEIDFLTFAPRERRVAYAASFGVPEVPTFLESRYRTWIQGIPHVSVREDQGAKIVHGLTGRDVPVVLDPTMLLERADWAREFTQRAALWEKPYAVKFFLGAATPSQESWVEQLAAERQVPVMDLNNPLDEKVADLDPLDFVAALSRAEFVATDSFHAGVFSLLHERPILVKSRDQTDSRLHTLFDKHGIPLEPTPVPGLSSALEPDWSAAAERLAEEREASWSFLREAMGPPARGESS